MGTAPPVCPLAITSNPPASAQANEHRNVQQIFPFAVEGIFADAPEDDWPTETFITWVELMVRLGRERARRRPAPVLQGRACAAAASGRRSARAPLQRPRCADNNFKTPAQMLRHRRNAPPGYTARDLDEIDAKANELIALLKRHWLPFQKSGFQTIKVTAHGCQHSHRNSRHPASAKHEERGAGRCGEIGDGDADGRFARPPSARRCTPCLPISAT
jgi:hypothetical protein